MLRRRGTRPGKTDEFHREHRLVGLGRSPARTFADGVRTQSLGELGYEHVSRLVDDMVAVSEQEIESALVALLGSFGASAAQSACSPEVGALLAGRLGHDAGPDQERKEGLPARMWVIAPI